MDVADLHAAGKGDLVGHGQVVTSVGRQRVVVERPGRNRPPAGVDAPGIPARVEQVSAVECWMSKPIRSRCRPANRCAGRAERDQLVSKLGIIECALRDGAAVVLAGVRHCHDVRSFWRCVSVALPPLVPSGTRACRCTMLPQRGEREVRPEHVGLGEIDTTPRSSDE